MTRLSAIRHVRQEHPGGCLIAVVAMITGRTYREALQSIGDPHDGLSFHTWQDALIEHGFAWQTAFRYCQLGAGGPREPWPLPLWAEAHICAVDAGRGDGSHCVVVLRDGAVLDPWREAPGRWADCRGVTYMAGIFDVGAGPDLAIAARAA